MLHIECPYCGPRDEIEFSCGGEAHIARPSEPEALSDAEWAEFVFMEENKAGMVREWWCHTATAYWFIAERDTVKDEIIRTYDAGEVFKERIEFTRPEPPKEA